MRAFLSWVALVGLAGTGRAQQPSLDDLEVKKIASGMAFTEGPVWFPKERFLVFSDIPRSKLMKWSLESGLELYRDCEQSNGNLLDLEGRLLTCQHGARNLIRSVKGGEVTVLADRYDGKRLNSPNDVAVQSDGTLWFTDPPWGLANQREGRELEGHWVYRLDPESRDLRVVIRDLAMPNGIALSPDEKRLYVADTGGHPSHPDPGLHRKPATLSAYEIGADNELSKEPAWRVQTLCDGMCVDEHGNVYATGRGVTVWKPDGTAIGAIKVPEQPANVCFGGVDYKTLFITARTSLYCVDLDVAGSIPPGARWRTAARNKLPDR